MEVIKEIHHNNQVQVLGRAQTISDKKAKKERDLIHKIGHAIAVTVTEVARAITYALFYFLAFTGYVRSSDFLNDLMGVNVAATTAHRAILPYVDFEKINHAYGFPVEESIFEVNVPMSVQLRLTADTNVLNNLPPTVSGSTAYWAGLGTSLTGVNKNYAGFCAKALNQTGGGPYVIDAHSTVVQAKSNLPGQQVFAWSGYDFAPSTVKAVTRIVSLKAIPDGTGNCTYSMKMYAQEAFELWEPSMATFNAYELNLIADKTGRWIFLPEETRFNWFFYRKYREDIIILAIVSQLLSVVVMAAGVMWRTPNRLSVYLDLDAMSTRYYNSLIINLIEVYIVFVDRYIIFRTVNAIDFFMTGGWGFDNFSMIMQFINIMGGFFFVILAVHKLAALIIYGLALAAKAAIDAKKSADFHGKEDPTRDLTPNSYLAIVKEGFRPNPELILVAVVFAPKYFYAGFFGGATKWGAVSMSNISAMGSCLGANLLMWNLLCTALTIAPLGFIMVIADGGKSITNSWVRHRLPGRCYNGFRDLVVKRTGKRIIKDYAENRILSIVEGIIGIVYSFFYAQQNNEQTELHYNVRIQELVQDSVFSEVECVRACLFVENIVERVDGETDEALRRKKDILCTVSSSGTQSLILRWGDGAGIHQRDLEELCFRKMQLGPSVPVLNALEKVVVAKGNEEAVGLLESGAGSKMESIRTPSKLESKASANFND
ncbi:UNVERIFIED_CONTAM: hypothetical protein HDU68_006703 [Siphonaria sp. JEL0065]|nr:hypothetical protein HDU68_006703 [Siphonaria sp. JEL0065]